MLVSGALMPLRVFPKIWNRGLSAVYPERFDVFECFLEAIRTDGMRAIGETDKTNRTWKLDPNHQILSIQVQSHYSQIVCPVVTVLFIVFLCWLRLTDNPRKIPDCIFAPNHAAFF